IKREGVGRRAERRKPARRHHLDLRGRAKTRGEIAMLFWCYEKYSLLARACAKSSLTRAAQHGRKFYCTAESALITRISPCFPTAARLRRVDRGCDSAHAPRRLRHGDQP